jgi:hypothetical protein
MPAIAIPDTSFREAQVFERGDRIYLTAPVQRFQPTEAQIEEFAGAGILKKQAPNENIVWFRGQYVEADRANGNGAMWKANELAIKSLTPMLMPVTVMHDPRTAVGTIADVKLLTPDKDSVPRSRLDTVLALWGHRFPDAVHEAEVNAQQGSLMQSMECYSPWYECSECGSVFHKLPQGAERAQWCAHLRASNPSAGYVDDQGTSQGPNASRILGDVCFTGTGLIFGTRGAQGAYSEAYLESFQDELAAYHQNVHTSTSPPRSDRHMALVQIEQSELDTLRRERDEARSQATAAQQKVGEVERERDTKIAEAETAKVNAERERDEVKTSLQRAEEEKAQAALSKDRMGKLGEGFVARLGDFTKRRLEEQAKVLPDDQWDERLKELEEVAQIKRDAAQDGKPAATGTSSGTGDGLVFGSEEVASLSGILGSDAGGGTAVVTEQQRAAVVGSLASAFRPAKKQS